MSRTHTSGIQRAVTLGAVAAIGIGVLAGCGTGTGASSSSKTLRVQIPTGPTATAMEQVGKDFEKANPGVKVTFEGLSSDSSRGPNTALLSSTATPDVGYIQRSTGVWSALLKNHQLTDLGSVWTADNLAQEYSPSQVASYTTGGHHYGVLYDELLIDPIYYNEDAFKKAGIQLPANHQIPSVAQFESMVAKLKAAGYQGLGVGGASPYDLGHLLDTLLPTAVSPAEYSGLLTNFKPGSPTTYKYTDPGVVTALRTIAQWKKAGIFETGMTGMDTPQVQALFTSGKLAMLQGGNYTYPDLVAAKPSFTMGWFLLPSLTPGRATPFDAYSGDTFVVPTKAANKALAEKFITFFMTAKYQKSVIAATGSLPVLHSIDPAGLTNLGSLVQQQLQSSQQVGQVDIWDSAVPTTLGQTFEVPLLQKLVGGSVTPQGAAQQLQAALEDLQSGKTSSDTD